MKRFGILFLILSVGLAACEKTGEETVDNTPEEIAPFNIEGNHLTFDCNGGTQEFSLTAPGAWTVTSSESWCTVSPAEGSGDSTVQVHVDANPDENDARSTRLTVKSAGLVLFVTVEQSSNPDAFFISTREVALPYTACDFEITVTSRSRAYEVTIVDEWISEVSHSGEPATGETIRFHAEANPSPEGTSRSGVVSVCTEDGSCIPVMVEQAGAVDRYVLGMRFTATWCGWCPYMDETFHKVAERDSRFVYVTFHASKGYPLYFSDCEAFVKDYKIDGFPTGVIGGWKTLDNYTDTDMNAQSAISMIDNFTEALPCTIDIQADAVVADGQLNVTADILSQLAGTYKVVALVLESGIVEPQTYYLTTGGSQKLNDFVHDNIARKTLTSVIRGDEFTIEANETKNFSWSTTIDAAWNAENLSALVWVFAEYGDLASAKSNKRYPDTYIINARSVPAHQ